MLFLTDEQERKFLEVQLLDTIFDRLLTYLKSECPENRETTDAMYNVAVAKMSFQKALVQKHVCQKLEVVS